MACSINGRSYTLLACRSFSVIRFFVGRGYHLPLCCINGMQYLPCSSRTPIKIGVPLHVMSTSSSLCTVTPSFVKMDIVQSSAVFPTLISELGKSPNVSASVALADKLLKKGSLVTCCAWLTHHLLRLLVSLRSSVWAGLLLPPHGLSC